MSLAESSDDATLMAAVPHDLVAFEELYLRYVRRVTAFAAQRCSCAEDVADVVAQTFFQLISAAKRCDPDRSEPASFLFGIAANVVREVHRRRS